MPYFKEKYALYFRNGPSQRRAESSQRQRSSEVGKGKQQHRHVIIYTTIGVTKVAAGTMNVRNKPNSW
jgi:hypothetical protein